MEAITTLQDSKALLGQILERKDSNARYRITLDFFDRYWDLIKESARKRGEFTHLQNMGDDTIEFHFEKYPKNEGWEDTESGKAILAVAGMLSDEEADELERWIEESRKTSGRDFDWP